MQESIEESISLDADEIFFQNFIYSGRAKQFRNAVLSYQDIDIFWKTFEQLENKFKDANLTLNFQGNFGPNPIGDNMYKRAAGYCNYCVAGKWKYLDQIYISPTKEIYPCMMLNNKQFKIGDVIRKNGKVALSYKDETQWEKVIPGFDRSSCASLMYMQNEIENG
jgi:MoaA/NifB/PqqE/SkfB family radical SAM enzyme